MSLIVQALRRMRQQLVQDGRPSDVSAKASASRVGPVVDLEGQLGEETDTLAVIAPRRTVHVDMDSLREAGLLPPESRERLVARQFRHIKLPLVAAAKNVDNEGERARLIMVASALPGEGKTFCSVNLALSMTRERDTEVLIVDADVAKPHISHAFGVADDPGLVDALTNHSLSIEDLILPTDIEGLSILPAGRFEEETATELLSSERMKEITSQIATVGLQRIAVFDTPPLLLTTESRVLGGLMGQIVLVVRAGLTSRQAVYDALDSLGQSRVVGLVFNQSTMTAAGGYSGYHSYGNSDGYGDYGNYGKTDATLGSGGAKR